MKIQRIHILLAIAAVLVLIVGWNLFSGPRTISLNVTDEPLIEVLDRFESQGGIRISTNMDPEAPITLELKRVPVVEAVDILAVRTDANWRTAYLIGPDKNAILDAVAAFEANDTSDETWQAWHSSFGDPGSHVTLDPRKSEWKVDWEGATSLSELLTQGSVKTSAMFATPAGWDPEIARKPASGRVSKTADSLASIAGGKSMEVFLLEGRPDWGQQSGGNGENAQRGERGSRSPRVFSRTRGDNEQENRDPKWVEERAENAIKQLPKEEQADARRELSEWRKLMAEIRALPQEERREKFRELMQTPAFRERMDERFAARDAKRTPEQRAQRYSRYLERKAAQKENQ